MKTFLRILTIFMVLACVVGTSSNVFVLADENTQQENDPEGLEEPEALLEEEPENILTSIRLAGQNYDFQDNGGYLFDKSSQVEIMSNGMTSIGSLFVEGTGFSYQEFQSFTGIGIKSGTQLTLKYTQSVGANSYGGNTWYLSSDTATSINNQSIGTLGNGAWIIYTSYDGTTWNYTGVNTVNINEKELSYTLAGTDIEKGVYVRVLCVAEIYYQYVSGSHTEYSGWWNKLWKVNGYTVYEYATAFRNIGTEYMFYVAYDTAEIALHSDAIQDFDLTDEELTESEQSILHRSTNLDEDAVSLSNISVDFLGHETDIVTVTYNGVQQPVCDGDIFTEPGTYEFHVTSIFGTTKEKTVYLLNPGEDLAFSQYFGAGFVDSSKRMYDDQYAVPTYMTGMTAKIQPANEFLPGLYGSIEYLKSDEEVEVLLELENVKESFEYEFTKEGIYRVSFITSKSSITTGEQIHYEFLFAISENTDYKPRLNQELLNSTNRSILYSTKILSVTLKTAGGGNYIYAFPAKEEYVKLAKELACQIETLSIESYTAADGTPYWYYKSADNDSIKVKYEGNKGKVLLYEVLNTYAEKNVNIIYIEPNSDYAILPVENLDALQNLTESSIERDVKVVANEALKEELQAAEVYINGFVFEQFAEYESASIIAIDCETGTEYTLPYGEDLASVLDHTMNLHLVESNWNGSIEQDVIYYQEGDNCATLMLDLDGVSKTIQKDSAEFILEANEISILSGCDPFDSQSILTLLNTQTAERHVMLLSEATGYSIPKGSWELSITNRIQSTISVSIKVNGVPEIVESSKNSTSSASVPTEEPKVVSKITIKDSIDTLQGAPLQEDLVNDSTTTIDLQSFSWILIALLTTIFLAWIPTFFHKKRKVNCAKEDNEL